MKNIRSYIYKLSASDLVIISFYLFLSVMNIIFHSKVEYWFEFLVYNTALIFSIFFIANKNDDSNSVFWEQLHYWYVVPLIFLTFKEIYFMIHPIRGVDYDNALIAIDRFLFGTDPTYALFKIANPYLTELLQIAYATFFFLPIILAVDLILNNRKEELNFEIFAIIYGFMLSYIGYFLFPAVGPRFTLHNFALTDKELPGLLLTPYLRSIVNAGESITRGAVNPIALVQRDAFPSGHTQMTLIVMYLSVKFKTKSRYFFLVDGTLLIFATVYLRYHYVADLLGGLIFMIFTMTSGIKLYNWWMKKTNRKLFEY